MSILVTACWHIQQSLEKAIKAALIAEGIDPPYTHDLVALLAALPSKWKGGLKDIIDLARVSSWTTEARYPGEMPPILRTDAQAAFAQAMSFIHEVERGIRMRLDNSGPRMV